MKLVAPLAYVRLHAALPDLTIYLGNTAPTSAEEAEDAFVVVKDGQDFKRANYYGSPGNSLLYVNIYVGKSKLLNEFEAGHSGPGAKTWTAENVKPQEPAEIAVELFNRIDPWLNDVTQTDWSEVVVSTRRSSELLLVPDGGGAVLLSSVYEVSTW